MVSIIIVHYKVKKELFNCLHSIINVKTKVPYEIIVIDNDEEKIIGKDLKKHFPKVVYIENDNKGFGEANNRGVAVAKGEYLFFLNPDTKVLPNAIDGLFSFVSKKGQTGAVSPLLLGQDHKPYHQGERLLTPFRGIVALSFINKLFPHNPVSRYYWDLDANYDEVRTIDVVPGTAFIIKREVFEKLGGFDEKFILYFEEFDFCKRLKEKGYKNYIIPTSQVVHVGGLSTKQRSDRDDIFTESRFYYFKKHFGTLNALIVQLITSLGKAEAFVGGVIILSLLVTCYKLLDRGMFIGDQGWFYLSARDMLLSGNVPLVGIPSSRPWLHQGALWTYLLGGALFIGKFHPLSGYVLSTLLGVMTTVGLYILGKCMFSKKVGLVASALYGTSLSIILLNQMPYHTTPIPLISIIFVYSLYKIGQGKLQFLPISFVALSFLYQLELFSVVLIPLVFFSVVYACKKNTFFTKKIMNVRLLLLTLTTSITSFLPILLYDIRHGFPQTFGFVAWMGYSVLKALGIISAGGEGTSLVVVGRFLIEEIKMFIFYPSTLIAFTVFMVASVVFIKFLLREKSYSYLLILLWVLLPIAGILITKTASDAYLPIIFPAFAIIISCGFVKTFTSIKVLSLVVTSIILVNIFSITVMFPQQHNVEKFSLRRRIDIAKLIVNEANGKPFRIVGRGVGSQFSSFTMNHEYLLWWLGGKIVKTPVDLEFIITENEDGIFITAPSQYARVLQ